VTFAAAAMAGELAFESLFGQVPQTLSGAPVQLQPYVPEPGVPPITITPELQIHFQLGTGQGAVLMGREMAATGPSPVTGAAGTTLAGLEGGRGGERPRGSNCNAGTAWGATAANAQAVGGNPSAPAAAARMCRAQDRLLAPFR
jgi:hypothetical protein